MKYISQRKFAAACFAVSAIMFLSEGLLSGQDAARPAASDRIEVQQGDSKIHADNSVTIQQQDQKKAAVKKEQVENQQKKTVKKVQSSSPDLSKRKGARPPSISRPTGSGMPKGAGKPAGITRPGRR